MLVLQLLTCRKNSILHKSVESYDENNYVENYEMTHFFLKEKNARSIEVVAVQVFIACGLGKSSGQAEDPFRKPKPGMWHILEQHFNSGISIDMDQ